MFTDRFQGISTAPVDRWKKDLDPGDAAVIELMAGEALTAAGYMLQTPITLVTRWRQLTWPLRRRFNRKDGTTH